MQSTKKQVGNWWNRLTPQKRKNLSIVALIAVILIGSLIAYEMQGGRHVNTKPYTKKELNLDTDLLEKSAYLESQKNLQGIKSDIEGIQKAMKNIDKARTDGEVVLNPRPTSDNVSPIQRSSSEVRRYPPIPPNSKSPQPTLETQKLPGAVEPVRIIGEIGMVKNEGISKSDKTEKKKTESQIFLPPSFMEATLLSGLDAPTTTNAKGNPSRFYCGLKTWRFCQIESGPI